LRLSGTGFWTGRRSAEMPIPVETGIRMVAINRLTGHSPGFFSCTRYPPNQAVSVQSQKKINGSAIKLRRSRLIKLILKKSQLAAQ